MQLPDFLTCDEHGDIRLAGHRFGLEDIAFYYDQGYSPEMLWETFPTLSLSRIHKTIGFYLDHRQQVTAYVEQRADASGRLKASLPPRLSLTDLRNRLEAKRNSESPVASLG